MGKNKIAGLGLGLAAILLLCAAAPPPFIDVIPDEMGRAPVPLHWPLPAGAVKYGAINGKHIWQYVAEQAQIAEHYRDAGIRNSGAASPALPATPRMRSGC